MSANANALNNSKNAVSTSWFSSLFGTKPAAKNLSANVKANNAAIVNNTAIANKTNAPLANANKNKNVPLAIGGSKKSYHRRGRTERRNRTRRNTRKN
jgi:hypothetical protein